ncbi:MAG: type II secretion system protein [Dehalococcoidales bacterium]|nr:type II secretion system protein [Dehalococcoidales bacterium]
MSIGAKIERIFNIRRVRGTFFRGESGTTLLETLVALAILGIISVAFLSGLTTTSRAAVISDRRATAESLAQSQLETVKQAVYVYEATQYTPIQVPDDVSYTGFSAAIVAEAIESPDDGVQKITVTITRSGEDIYVLQGYKVDR